MKYAVLALLGVLSVTQAHKIERNLIRLNTYDVNLLAQAEEGDDDDSDSEEEKEELMIDATMGAKPCVYLDETGDELNYQMDMFSRTLDPRHWTNVLNIADQLGKKGAAPKLSVHTWELYDGSFSFPRVRRYQYVQENMDMLEHFEDNLNSNISNSQHMANFLRVANTVRKNLLAKYNAGEFSDPGNTDPKKEAEKEPSW